MIILIVCTHCGFTYSYDPDSWPPKCGLCGKRKSEYEGFSADILESKAVEWTKEFIGVRLKEAGAVGAIEFMCFLTSDGLKISGESKRKDGTKFLSEHLIDFEIIENVISA